MTNEERQAVQNIIKYLYPEINRGPANDNWLGSMKTLAYILKWDDCHECEGLGEILRLSRSDCCSNCYGIGKVAQ